MAYGIEQVEVEYDEQAGAARRVTIAFGGDGQLELTGHRGRAVLILRSGGQAVALPVDGPRDLYRRAINLIRLRLPQAGVDASDERQW